MSNSIIPTAILQEVMDAMDDMATDSRLLDMKQSRVHQFDAARVALRAAMEQPDPAPYLWFDPDTGETWPHDAINRCCHLPDFLIAPYTKGSKMSLDFSLNAADKCVFSRNITHNLNKMARAAGIYDVLWRPDENGITKASQCIELLSAGLLELVRNRAKYETYNSPNGWGIYEHFVPFVAAVLTACCDYPDAEVSVSR